MFSNKRFRSNPAQDETLNPVPQDLKRYLNLIGCSFNTTNKRKLDLMDTQEKPLYGFITHYEGNNFCWIQPTRTFDKNPEMDYDNYIKRVNYDARLLRLEPVKDLKVGEDCVARYDADNCWYRAMVVGEPVNGRWLVLFIDYGNLQRCATGDICAPVYDPKSNCDHFLAPMQAVCCRLYNIVPRHPSCRAEIDAYLESFYAKHSSEFLEIVVKQRRSDFVVDCDVFRNRRATKGKDRLYLKHIGQELVNKGLATFADEEAAHTQRKE